MKQSRNYNGMMPYPMYPYGMGTMPDQMNMSNNYMNPSMGQSSGCSCSGNNSRLEQRVDNLERRISKLENMMNNDSYVSSSMSSSSSDLSSSSNFQMM